MEPLHARHGYLLAAWLLGRARPALRGSTLTPMGRTARQDKRRAAKSRRQAIKRQRQR